jgi:hypothetical protein
VRRLSTIALALGEERTRSELIPFLTDAQVSIVFLSLSLFLNFLDRPLSFFLFDLNLGLFFFSLNLSTTSKQ